MSNLLLARQRLDASYGQSSMIGVICDHLRHLDVSETARGRVVMHTDRKPYPKTIGRSPGDSVSEVVIVNGCC